MAENGIQANNVEQTKSLTKKAEEARRKGLEDLRTKLQYILDLFSEKDAMAKLQCRDLAKRWESRVWELTQMQDSHADDYTKTIDDKLHDLDKWDTGWNSNARGFKETGKELRCNCIFELFPADFELSRSLIQRNFANTHKQFAPKALKTRKCNTNVDTNEFMPPIYTPVNQDQAIQDAIAAAAKVKEAILNEDKWPKGQLSPEDEKRRKSRRDIRNAVKDLVKLLSKTNELSKLDISQLAALRETAVWEKTRNATLDSSKYDEKILDELQDLGTWEIYWDSDEADPGSCKTGCDLFRQYVPNELVDKSHAVVHKCSLNYILDEEQQPEELDETHERTSGRKELESAIEDLIKHYPGYDKMTQVDIPKVAEAWESRIWQDTYAKTGNIGDYRTQVEKECVDVGIYRDFWDSYIYNGKTGLEAFRQYFEDHFGDEYLLSYSAPQHDLDDELYDLAGGNDDEYQYDYDGYDEQEEGSMASAPDHILDSDFWDALFADQNDVVESPTSPPLSQQGPSGDPIIELMEGEFNDDNASLQIFEAVHPSPPQLSQVPMVDDDPWDIGIINSNSGANTSSFGSAHQNSHSCPNKITAGVLQLDDPSYDIFSAVLMQGQDQDQSCDAQCTSRAPPQTEQYDAMDLECDITSENYTDTAGAYLVSDVQVPAFHTMSATDEPHHEGAENVDMFAGDTDQSLSESRIETMIPIDPTLLEFSQQMFATEDAYDKDEDTNLRSTHYKHGSIFTITGITSREPSKSIPTPMQSSIMIDFDVNTANLGPLRGEADAPQAPSQPPMVISQQDEISLAELEMASVEPSGEYLSAMELDEVDEVAVEVQGIGAGIPTLEKTAHVAREDHDAPEAFSVQKDTGPTLENLETQERKIDGAKVPEEAFTNPPAPVSTLLEDQFGTSETQLKSRADHPKVSEADRLCSRIIAFEDEWRSASRASDFPHVFSECAQALFKVYENINIPNGLWVLNKLKRLTKQWHALRKATDTFFRLTSDFSNQEQSAMQLVARDFEDNLYWQERYLYRATRDRAAGSASLASRWERLAIDRAQANEELFLETKIKLDGLADCYWKHYDALQELQTYALDGPLAKPLKDMADKTLTQFRGPIKEAFEAFNAPFEGLSVDDIDYEL
ncbi:Nn.00g047140.m01.CDS01 [Neocucurbitaria sp. VM-36]